jgi:hypothetical protein
LLFFSTISSPPARSPNNHVKIDVDGHENKVVRGMRGCSSDGRCARC